MPNEYTPIPNQTLPKEFLDSIQKLPKRNLGDLLQNQKPSDLSQLSNKTLDLSKITTPLEKAVAHLLRIGSTDLKEVREMSAFFVTEEDACKKLGLSFGMYLCKKFRDDVISNASISEIESISINQECVKIFSDCGLEFEIKELGNDNFSLFGYEIAIDYGMKDYYLIGNKK